MDVPALRTPTGELVPDLRSPGSAVPSWVTDTLNGAEAPTPLSGPLATDYLVYGCISQRGKGGVYVGIDLRCAPARRVIIKEGRLHGETDWDGRDGRSRVAHEVEALRDLGRHGIPVPRVWSTFESGGHLYAALEYVEGRRLDQEATAIGIRALADLLRLGCDVANVVQRVHDSGWVWRDCKAANLIVTADGIRPIDFEGSCRIDDPDPWPWGSPGHLPPEWKEAAAEISQDLFALGAVLHHVFTGRLPTDDKSWPHESAIPTTVRNIVDSLLGEEPQNRPRASDVLRGLKGCLIEDFA